MSPCETGPKRVKQEKKKKKSCFQVYSSAVAAAAGLGEMHHGTPRCPETTVPSHIWAGRYKKKTKKKRASALLENLELYLFILFVEQEIEYFTKNVFHFTRKGKSNFKMVLLAFFFFVNFLC